MEQHTLCPKTEPEPRTFPYVQRGSDAKNDGDNSNSIRPGIVALTQLLVPLSALQLAELQIEEPTAVSERLTTSALLDIATGAEGASAGDAAATPAATPGGQGVGRVFGEQAGGALDGGVEVEPGVLRQLRERKVQHVGLGEVLGGDEVGAAVERHAREHVEGEGGLAREQGVEQARDVGQPPHVVREHGQGVGEGEVGLRLRQVRAQRRVLRPEDVRDQAQLRHRRREARQHGVADPQRREPRHGGGAPRARREHQQEHLADVVVALEVAEVRLPP